MPVEDVIAQLRSHTNPVNVAGMAKFGIRGREVLGVSLPVIRQMAKSIGKDHALALELWASGIHEARILASIIDVPTSVTEAQMEQWVQDFDAWDVCDQCCLNLFRRTEWAYLKAEAWSHRPAEFEKRAAFALMATLAVHDKQTADAQFEQFLLIIVREAVDERNFVKKAVNWALRQIGKRNWQLNTAAIETARHIASLDSKSARWIANDALRELTGEKVRDRLPAEKV